MEQMGYSNEDVVRGLRNGTDKMISYFYELNFPKVKKFIIANGGSEDDAKDVFQESMLACIENIRADKFKGNSTLNTYLHSIAKFQWYSECKKRKSISLDFLKDEKGWQQADYEMEPLDEEKTQTALKQVFKDVSEECKELLVKFYYERLDLKDIADKMGYSYAFVRVKKNRCMNNLKSKIHVK